MSRKDILRHLKVSSWTYICIFTESLVCCIPGHQNISTVDDEEEEEDDDGSMTSILTRSDAGLYTCVVKNIAGHVAHNISLFIEGHLLN